MPDPRLEGARATTLGAAFAETITETREELRRSRLVGRVLRLALEQIAGAPDVEYARATAVLAARVFAQSKRMSLLELEHEATKWEAGRA